jgi:hypothetical protein
MSKSDNKWVDKVRDELNNYKPSYNAADWEALKPNLPKANGWLGIPNTLLNWIKGAILVSAASALVFIGLKIIDQKNSKNDFIKDEITELVEETNPITSNLNKNNDESAISSENEINEVKKLNSNTVGASEEIVLEKDKKTNQKRKTESLESVVEKNIPKQSLVAVVPEPLKSNNNSLNTTDQYPIEKAKPQNKAEEPDGQKFADEIRRKKQNLVDNLIEDDPENEVSILPENMKNISESNESLTEKKRNDTHEISENLNMNTPEGAESKITKDIEKGQNADFEVNNDSENIKQKLESPDSVIKDSTVSDNEINEEKKANVSSSETNIAPDSNSEKNNSKKNKQTKKTKELAEKTPFYVGANGTFNYNYGLWPYNSNVNISEGLIFEKVLAEKRTIALKPNFNINKFKHSESNIRTDTTIITSYELLPGDSVMSLVETPVYTDTKIETPHNLKLIYVDFLLVYTQYFIYEDFQRFGFSFGISNKYFLEAKFDGNEVSFNNKLYLVQSGQLGFRYQRRLNNGLFLDIEPFMEIPFRKVSDNNYNWNSFGVNIGFLFQTN